MEGRVSVKLTKLDIGKPRLVSKSGAWSLCYGSSFVRETLTRAGRSEFSLDWRVSGDLVRAAKSVNPTLPHITASVGKARGGDIIAGGKVETRDTLQYHDSERGS
jgi:hypothetical protein